MLAAHSFQLLRFGDAPDAAQPAASRSGPGGA